MFDFLRTVLGHIRSRSDPTYSSPNSALYTNSNLSIVDLRIYIAKPGVKNSLLPNTSQSAAKSSLESCKLLKNIKTRRMSDASHKSYKCKGVELIRKGDERLYCAKDHAASKRAKMRRSYNIYVAIQLFLTALSVGCAFLQIYLAKDAENTEKEAWNVVLIILSVCLSFTCFIVIIIRYSAKHQSFSLRMSYKIGFFRFLSLRKKVWSFLFELIFVWVLPYSSNPAISKWLITVMIFRLVYPIALVIHSFSDLKKEKATICENLKMFNQKSPKFGLGMNLRYVFRYHGIIGTILIYASFILFFSYMFFASDRFDNGTSETPRELDYHVTIYWAVITATTVGYGDITPVGTYQQALSIVLALIGVVMSSLLMGFITSSMGLKDNEKKALQVAEKKMLEREEKNLAAKVIQNMARIKHYKIGKEIERRRVEKIPRFVELRDNLFTAMSQLSDIQETLKNKYNFDPDRAENTESWELLTGAKELDDRNKRLVDLLNTTKDMMSRFAEECDPFRGADDRNKQMDESGK